MTCTIEALVLALKLYMPVPDSREFASITVYPLHCLSACEPGCDDEYGSGCKSERAAEAKKEADEAKAKVKQLAEVRALVAACEKELKMGRSYISTEELEP